jgi:hypothetical protein
MAVSAAKVAPSLVVLAFTGYCVWPSVSELMSDAPPPPAVKVPELSGTLFSPALPSRPAKNPWGGLDETALAAAKAAHKAAGASTGAAAAKKGVDPLDSLRLEATCILGNERLAMINGQLYAPQKTPSAGNASMPFRVVSVSPNKVLLECNGKTLELTYEGIVSRPAASAKPAPAKTATPKADRGGPTAAAPRPTSPVKKPAAAQTASPPGGKKPSGKSGD